MKKKLLVACTIAAVLFSCSKEEVVPNHDIQQGGYKIVEENDKLIVYPVNNGSALTAHEAQLTEEITMQLKDASFYPNGVVRNQEGEIDFSQSITGKKYQIAYEEGAANRVMDNKLLVLSGISYQDGVYKVYEGQNTAAAVYNGDASLEVPEGAFELKDVNAQTIQQPVKGEIDLKQIADLYGVGSYTVDYELYDASNGATNSTQVKIYVFETIDDVPEELMYRVNGTGRTQTGDEEDEIIVITYPPN